jgi:NADPH2:quinone reductase
MRAWLMDSYEGIEQLRLGDVPDPQPGPDDVLLRVKLAALNPADAFLAQGQYPAKPPLPHILGRDAVGDVLAMGSKVGHVHVGQTVGVFRCKVGVEVWGTLAEKVVVPASNLIGVPDGWSLEETAAAPLVFLTAWQALTQWSDPPAPPPGRTALLVTGASGGVGVASVLLGHSLGLTVLALSRSAEKRRRLTALGARHVFDPADQSVASHILSTISPQKVDLVIDTVGGPMFREIVATLGYRGRISVVGRSGGVVPEFNTASLFFRRNRIGGVAVGDYTAEAAQAAWHEIVARLDVIKKRPVVDSIFGFNDVKQAFARLAEGPMGKVLIRGVV